MIEVLLGGDLHGELDRVAMAARVLPRRQPRGRRRGLDVPVTPAAILLPAMADEDKPPLDDGHLFGVLELAGHRIQGLTALWAALAIRLVEFVDLIHDGQAGLHAGPVPGPGRRRGGGLGRRRGPLLARCTEQGLIALRQELLQEGELLLQHRTVLAAQARELGEQGLDLFVDPMILAIEEAGGLS